MNVSLDWLSEYVDLPDSIDGVEEVLTRCGLSVEAVERRGAPFENVVVAEILESVPHPNADRLSVCRVNDGSGEPRQIVCGAKNYAVGDRVPLALPGAVLPGDFRIKSGKLRGESSDGMLCSARELLLADDAEGLLILPATAKPGAPISDLYPPDTMLELEITPNRPDWLGHIGVARELAAFTRTRLAEPATEEAVPVPSTALAVCPGCPLYTARVFSSVKVQDSPDWMRRRLEVIGLRPINNIVDITNYVMMETGQPLHAFDARAVDGPLRVRTATAGEHFLALNGVEYELREEDLVIADDSRILALAGIMGGEHSGVTEDTQEVILESARFDPHPIRKTSRRLGLSSDSSYRFERGVDPAGVLRASKRAAYLIKSLASGEPGAIEYAGVLPGPDRMIRLRLSQCERLLGVRLTEHEVKEALEPFGLRMAEDDHWEVPSHRGDLTREVDLIEEVARAVGIENIPARVRATPSPTSAADRAHDAARALRSMLAARGLCECRSGTLTTGSAVSENAHHLANPMGSEGACLRTSLVPGLIDAMESNLRHQVDGVALFEIGRTFSSDPDSETEKLALLVTGPRYPSSWQESTPPPYDLFALLGLLSFGGLSTRQATASDPFGLRADLLSGKNPVGWLAQLQPAAARDLGARHPVFVAEIDMAAVTPSGRLSTTSPLSLFPSSCRDIAVVVQQDKPFCDLENGIRAAHCPLLTDLHPISVFTDPTGEKLPTGMKSVAISLTFQSDERTLESKEIDSAVQQIKDHLRQSLHVDFRE